MTRVSTITAVVAALFLAASVSFAWNGVREAATTVAQGDAQRLVALVQERLQATGHRPTSEDLDAICEALAPEGVRSLGIRDRHGEVTSRSPVAGMALPLPGPGEMDSSRGVLRISSFLRPPRHADGHAPPPPPDEGRPPLDTRGPRGNPILVIEFESATAAALLLRSRITLALGLGAAVLLVLAAWVIARAGQDRRRAMAEAARTRHLASLGEMSAVLAHEIRNPLASLKGHAQLLEESLEGDPRSRAQRVVREAARIERLTEDLLRFVRSGAAIRAPVDLGTLIRELEGPPAILSLRLGGHDRVVSVDAERIRSALGNLLENARQASASESVELEVFNDGPMLTFAVRDRGPGIPEGAQEQIFEPFHTTRTQGTGLGLAIARRVATAHGGSLVAMNRVGGGAEFLLRIPLED